MRNPLFYKYWKIFFYIKLIDLNQYKKMWRSELPTSFYLQ